MSRDLGDSFCRVGETEALAQALKDASDLRYSISKISAAAVPEQRVLSMLSRVYLVSFVRRASRWSFKNSESVLDATYSELRSRPGRMIAPNHSQAAAPDGFWQSHRKSRKDASDSP